MNDKIKRLSPYILTPHPLNEIIYGSNEDISSLIESIKNSCPQWRDKSSPQETRLESSFALQLLLPTEWQELIAEKAASLEMDATAWITYLIRTNLFSAVSSE
jgi:hypothetical protein